LGGSFPVIDVVKAPNSGIAPHVSLSNVIFAGNYVPDLPAAGGNASSQVVDALISVDEGSVRLEQVTFQQNPHRYLAAATTAAGRVYASPQVTVQVLFPLSDNRGQTVFMFFCLLLWVAACSISCDVYLLILCVIHVRREVSQAF
jgi:hypothetical protein